MSTTQEPPKQEQKQRTEKPKKEKPVKEKKAAPADNKPAGKKVNKDGIETKKEDNFSDWYSEVITKSEMIEYYDVSGCYILRPWAFSIWDQIRDFVDAEIKKLGVQNSYFPMFVTKKALETEESHVEGFSPEVAWVTKAGDSVMAQPVAIRPTSETIMYPAFSKWIRSHRDLPLKLNQWCNVVRWEFKYPVPFLRTREFLWQEGHTAFANLKEAEEEVLQILDIYRRVYEELLGVPVVKGKKTENEKFAGGHYTTTVEAYIPANGRAVQGATSHCLGQNFSKMFDICFEADKGTTTTGTNAEKNYVWQNSWGLTTRTIGVMVMVHSDNSGLVLPPRIAPVQVVVIPFHFKDADNDAIDKKAIEVAAALKAAGLRVQCDDRDYKNPGYKRSYWELKGVPLRIEIGPKDLAEGVATVVRRDNFGKSQIKLETIVDGTKALLDTLQNDLLAKAKGCLDSHTDKITNWDKFVTSLDSKNVVLAPFCEAKTCEEALKEKSATEAKKLSEKKKQETPEQQQVTLTSAAKSLCIPFTQPELPADAKCFHCGAPAKSWTLFGRSY